MASVTDIRTGIAANLGPLKAQTSAYLLSGWTPPTIWVFPASTEYDLAMRRGLDKLTFTVQAIVGQVSDIGSQKNLDEFLEDSGPTSVKAAIESDSTLGGSASDLRVTGRSGYQQVAIEGRGQMLVAEWTVEVYAPGTT